MTLILCYLSNTFQKSVDINSDSVNLGREILLCRKTMISGMYTSTTHLKSVNASMNQIQNLDPSQKKSHLKL